MLYDDTVILLFAKAPVEGEVNTRLIPDIGVHAATRLQHDLIHQRLTMLRQADLCTVQLMCSPDTQHVCFKECAQQYPVFLKAQTGNDLGARMFNAANEALQHYSFCVLIGSDAPALVAVAIKQAIETLRTGASNSGDLKSGVLKSDAPVVFVPAEDGGYVLLGLQQAHNFLFEGIRWGSADVMSQSRVVLDFHQISYTELTPCWDVDRIADYQRYLSLDFT